MAAACECGRVALAVDTMLPGPLGEAAASATRLADAGFDGAFTFEGPTDVFLPLAVAAASGADLDLYTNVAIAFPRSPTHLAHLADDLQRASGGRFCLGLGPQVRAHVERRYGSAFEHPVARMRELVLATKTVQRSWATGERLDFRGDFYELTLMTPMFDPGPNPFGPAPIWLGALGPLMTRMAAEVADGVLVMPFTTDRFVRERTMPAIVAGLAAGGRTGADVSVVCEVIVCAGRDERELAAAEAGVRSLLSFYGSTPAYRPVLDLEGWSDLHEELHRLSRAGDWGTMAELVDDDVLHRIAVHGSPGECAAQITARCAGVADRVAFYLPYEADLGCLAEVVAALRAPS
jgi:probable F420-dependent oxidoreductase